VIDPALMSNKALVAALEQANKDWDDVAASLEGKSGSPFEGIDEQISALEAEILRRQLSGQQI
jgi:hypothetical protein